MINDDHLYLDRPQLAARGWTRTLMERFLQSPDRWATVDHWKNYTGKATYFIEKVIVEPGFIGVTKLMRIMV